MQPIISFLTQYKELILLALSVLLSIVLIFVKRKPKTIDDFTLALSEVLSLVPELVSKVEMPSNGALKKSKVIEACLNAVSVSLSRPLTAREKDIVSKKVGFQIEDVLSTPKKKL